MSSSKRLSTRPSEDRMTICGREEVQLGWRKGGGETHVVLLHFDIEALRVLDRGIARVGASLNGKVERVLLLLGAEDVVVPSNDSVRRSSAVVRDLPPHRA